MVEGIRSAPALFRMLPTFLLSSNLGSQPSLQAAQSVPERNIAPDVVVLVMSSSTRPFGDSQRSLIKWAPSMSSLLIHVVIVPQEQQGTG